MSDMEEALARIRREAEEQTGRLDLRGLKLDELPEEMFALTHLQGLFLGWDHKVEGSVQITDGESRFQAFVGLKQLEVRGCDLNDLAFVKALTQLQMLHCSFTLVNNLAPLSGLTQLRELDCSDTSVSDLAPLHNLTQLRVLYCSYTSVSDLAPLFGLMHLQHLDCSCTLVSGLDPLSDLTQLQQLYFFNTLVNNLAPLRGLTRLQWLDCSGTSVNDLAPVRGLKQLRWLNCSSCPLADLPEELIRAPALEHLYLSSVTLPGWPATGVLSSHDNDNCLPRVRAHLDDLAEGALLDPRIKLLILGNGGAGKTQIANWLADAGYRLNPDWDSTHGIEVRRAALAGDPPLTLSIWDFGGQDLYHGVHALFLNSPALLLLVWATDTENRGGHGDGELWFRDHPLPYWLSLARHQAHAYSPLILAQSKCDRVEDRVRPFPVEAAALDALPYPARQLYLSVGAGTGRDGLVEEMRIAANWLRDPTRMGVPRVGTGRVAVRDRMEEMRAAGTRLLSMVDFRAVCAEIGGVSAPEHLLTWLDAEGVVFHRPGLFQDQVVLDPSWALDAIYTVFDRQSGMAKRIQRQRGRFTRDLLSDTLWRDYSVEEQEVFLSMMVSCGICFVLREWPEDGEWLREYVAPDLLPERDAVVGLVPVRWSDSAPTQQAVYTYPMLHGGLIRTILSRIGGMAGEDALYWRGGLCGYETEYRSRFLIEQEMTGDWSGRITVRTQDGDAPGLLSRLQDIVERAAALIGLRGEPAAEEKPRRVVEVADAETPPALKAGPEPRKDANWYVSYAWGRDAEGRSLEEKVDLLMTQAADRNVTILRDRNVLRIGDSIRGFMNNIGDGDRIFVVLSDKYLKSPYCMYELYAIWYRSGADPGAFFDRVCLWVHPDITMRDMGDRMRYALHWKQRHEALDKQQRKLGLDGLSDEDIAEYRYIAEFHRSVSKILFSLFDRVGPRDWDDFLKHGFRP